MINGMKQRVAAYRQEQMRKTMNCVTEKNFITSNVYEQSEWAL